MRVLENSLCEAQLETPDLENPLTWLDHLQSDALKYWLRETDVPMLATMPDGQILWTNAAYERLTGYSAAELEEMSWSELTEHAGDRSHDQEMAATLVTGGRTSYQFSKQYKHKTSRGPMVTIDVLRYPAIGDFEFFLVSVLPLDRGYNQALKEVEKLHNLLMDFITLQKKATETRKDSLERVADWAKSNPKAAWLIGIVAFVFILGSRLLEIIKEVMGLVSGGSIAP